MKEHFVFVTEEGKYLLRSSSRNRKHSKETFRTVKSKLFVNIFSRALQNIEGDKLISFYLARNYAPIFVLGH